MLNPFPIQFLALLAYFILRVFLGFILIGFSIRHARARKAVEKAFTVTFPYSKFFVVPFIAAELIVGTMFVLGFYTQIAALITMAIALLCIIFHKRSSGEIFESRSFYALVFGCAASLFITGAGALAFDLPL